MPSVRSWGSALLLTSWVLAAGPLRADHTPTPGSVVLAGSFQSELGCPGDWQADCLATALTYDASDAVWQGLFTVPAGSWEYKAALNGTWDENYGANATPSGANIGVVVAAETPVKFYYDHASHWITDSVNSVIAIAAGSFQSELGCPGDWQEACLRSWLQDPDGDGVYAFATTAIPPGTYEAKVAIAESWTENYGEGGVQNGANIPFTVVAAGAEVLFRYDAATHVLSITVTGGGGHDDDVEYFGLGHDSHDLLYRHPFGAITPGTPLTLRFRTYHGDVTGVQLRLWDTAVSQQSFHDLSRAAEDVSCFDGGARTCDFWEVELTPTQPTTLYYRFIVRDGSATAFYDDDFRQNGGWGEATPTLQDDSWAVTVHDPAFQPVDWVRDGVFYQIFPDRFRNGRADNDPDGDETRYGYPPEDIDRIRVMGWDELPEGYCRGYVDPATPCEEVPRGRDYFGGDLRGVQQRLNYLEALGVTAVYLNPIFDAASNHAYDTQDYLRIDPFFGSERDYDLLVNQAERQGIRLVLDGVFNHVSSDSPYFDRSHHFEALGACESLQSPYRDWFSFYFQADGPCAGPAGYASWFGFDMLPVLDKSHPEVRELFNGPDGIARYWLARGASGWRLDVMSDPAFPDGFWEEFRLAVKDARPDAVIIGELWKKGDVLPFVHGDRADAAMNYRFRNAVLGFFGRIDDKGFPDDGQSDQPPSLFAEKLRSIREDNPDASYYNALNLLGTHDTQRILWALTPGEDNREAREYDPANVTRGKQLLRLAAVVQMTLPGAPTLYYGDEVGLTGDDDPDDRRTFPWQGEGEFGEGGDLALLEHYRQLTALRHAHPLFREGELTFLLTDDAQRTVAYLMRTGGAGAVVAVNRSEAAQTLAVPLEGRLPEAVRMYDALGTVGPVTAAAGVLMVTLPGLSAAILLPEPGQDLIAPAAPTDLTAEEGSGQVALVWTGVSDAVAYRVYRSPLSHGGFVLVGESDTASFVDLGAENGRLSYYRVRAVDAAGNAGAASAEVGAVPHLTIGWANLQWPPTLTHVLGTSPTTGMVYGQVWIDGVTSAPGATPGLIAQLGFGPEGSDPTGPTWSWTGGAFNVDAGNNDEFVAALTPQAAGIFDYAWRYSTDGGRDWLHVDLDGPGLPLDTPGKLTVTTTDTTPPADPSGLHVVSSSPAGVELAWTAVPAPDLSGYEVGRSTAAGGPYVVVATAAATNYTDTDVGEGQTWYYAVRAVDTSFNRSGWSNEVEAVVALRTVTLTLTVTVPGTTPGDATVYVAGSLSALDGGLPDWDPAGVALTQVDATTWRVTLSGLEGTPVEYKYTLGSWAFVEKGSSCEELANRSFTLAYGTDGTQAVADAVDNWRNVPPCGD